MINLYNAIWVDAIKSFRKHHPHKNNWKLTIFIYMTWIMAINLWIVLLWLKIFNIFDLPQIKLNIFPGSLIDSFVSFIIRFTLPFVILNYFLIFFRDRYKRLISKYDNLEVRYAPIYSFFILGLALLSIVLHGIINN